MGGYLGSARGEIPKAGHPSAPAEGPELNLVHLLMVGIAEQMRAHELVRGSLGAYAKTFF